MSHKRYNHLKNEFEDGTLTESELKDFDELQKKYKPSTYQLRKEREARMAAKSKSKPIAYDDDDDDDDVNLESLINKGKKKASTSSSILKTYENDLRRIDKNLSVLENSLMDKLIYLGIVDRKSKGTESASETKLQEDMPGQGILGRIHRLQLSIESCVERIEILDNKLNRVVNFKDYDSEEKDDDDDIVIIDEGF